MVVVWRPKIPTDQHLWWRFGSPVAEWVWKILANFLSARCQYLSDPKRKGRGGGDRGSLRVYGAFRYAISDQTGHPGRPPGAIARKEGGGEKSEG